MNMEQKLKSLRARLGHKTKKINSLELDLEILQEKFNLLKSLLSDEELEEVEKKTNMAHRVQHEFAMWRDLEKEFEPRNVMDEYVSPGELYNRVKNKSKWVKKQNFILRRLKK